MHVYKLGPVSMSFTITSTADNYRELFGMPSGQLSEQAFRTVAHFRLESKPIVLSEWFLWNDHSRRAMRWRKMRQVRKAVHATC